MKAKLASAFALIGLIVAACGGSAEERPGQAPFAATVIMPNTISSPEVAAALKSTQATAAMNVENDKHLNLLVRVFLDDGNMVSFYEPSPGHPFFTFMYVGGKTLDVRVPNAGSLSAVALYQALVPGSTIPDALQAAQDRQDALALTPLAQPNSSTMSSPSARRGIHSRTCTSSSSTRTSRRAHD